MLVLRRKKDKKIFRFYTVDFHHHIGADEGGYESQPTGPNGSYEMCKKLLDGDSTGNGLRTELVDNTDDYSFELLEDKQSIEYHPVMQLIANNDTKLSTAYAFEKTLVLDQMVLFPALDPLRFKTEIEYEACNDQVRKWNEQYPHSLRLIGFGRLNPEQYPISLKELDSLVKEKGLRGLKLHPSSEDFMIGSDNLKEVVKACCKHNIPVIFHTTYASEVTKLEEMANEIILELFEAGEELYLNGLKLVAGHCTYTSKDVFKALSHPCIYGDLSLLNSPIDYLKKAKESIDIDHFYKDTLPELTTLNQKITKDTILKSCGPRLTDIEWSSKLLFATDHPFVPYSKPLGLIKALLHSDGVTDPKDIERILGMNALRLIPPKIYRGIAKRNMFKNISLDKFVYYLVQRKKGIFFEPLINTSAGGLLTSNGVISVTTKGNEGFSGYITLDPKSDDGSILEITNLQHLIGEEMGRLNREIRTFD